MWYVCVCACVHVQLFLSFCSLTISSTYVFYCFWVQIELLLLKIINFITAKSTGIADCLCFTLYNVSLNW